MEMDLELDKKLSDDGSIVPKKARNKKIRQPNPRSGKGFAAGFVLGIFLILMLLVGIGAAFYMNINDLQLTAIQTIRLDEKTFDYLEQELAALDESFSELSAGQQVLKSDRIKLEQDRTALIEQQAELMERIQEVEAVSLALSEQKAELDSIVSLYEAMEPDVAAAILTEGEDMAQTSIILKNMQDSKLALILAEMESQQASDLITLMATGVFAPTAADDGEEGAE